METVRTGMQLAKKHWETIIFDPAPAKTEAIHLLKYAINMNSNESELLLLMEKKAMKKCLKQHVKSLLENLLQMGPEVVIVT